MQPLFFVQNNFVERLTVPVARFAYARGLSVQDRSSSSSFDPLSCGVDWSQAHPVLPYGSVQFVRKLKAAGPLSRYVHHEEAQFSAQTWQEQLPCMLNAHGRIVCVRDVAPALAETPAHVRPLQEDKAFTAALLSQTQWLALAQERKLPPDLPCWVSAAKDIFSEWRLWVIGGAVVGASRYRHAGTLALEPGAPEDVRQFAQAVAATWLPAPCVAMDVARTPLGLKVVEFNPIHCCGWYAAPVDEILQAWLDWSLRNM